MSSSVKLSWVKKTNHVTAKLGHEIKASQIFQFLTSDEPSLNMLYDYLIVTTQLTFLYHHAFLTILNLRDIHACLA